jgi:hypothetical protein
MRKAALSLILTVLGAGAVAAGQKSYRNCRISNGQIFSCEGSWFQGTAVVYTDR